MPSLTLEQLNIANKLRSEHTHPASRNWCLGQWSNATLGELGEAANLIKKVERGDFTLDEVREELGKELADVLCYLDMLAEAAGISLDKATVDKFNEVSVRSGSPIGLIEHKGTIVAARSKC